MKQHKPVLEESTIRPDSFEQRVCRQLVEALLFEQVISFQLEGGMFTFKLNNTTYQAQGKVGSFGRIRLIEGSIYYRFDVTDEIRQNKRFPTTETTLERLLEDLPVDDAMRQTLSIELQQTIKLCQWNQQNLLKYDSRRDLSYLELESALDEGHPYHPCFKARTGFSTEDHALYGPESGNTFQLHWLAIDRSLLQQALPQENREFWLVELGTTHLVELEMRLLFRMKQPAYQFERYNLMPIHPWQWASIGHSLLGELLEQEKIIHLGAAGDFYQASISVRTLVNVSRPEKPNIKLPMNMVNTSSRRTIEPHSVCTAPLISKWLNRLVEQDTFLKKTERLGLLDEYAGIVLNEKVASSLITEPNWSANIEGQLSVIFRKSLPHVTPESVAAIPFTALMAKEQDGKAFIHPWLKLYGIKEWLSSLIDVAVIPVWHLLVHHGIALEAHAQNMVLLHKNGWPNKVILRDFHESLEYQKDYLANPELQPDFAELHPDYTTESGQAAPDNQYFWMDSVEALRELIVDTLFVFNLTEISFLLSEEYSFTETEFWAIVDSRLKTYAKEGHTPPARIAEIPLNKANISTESLIKKKFSGQRDGVFHHTIPNALHCNGSPSTGPFHQRPKAKPKTALKVNKPTLRKPELSK